MGARIPPVDADAAEGRCAALLRAFDADWGAAWNITRVMANAPAVLEMFRALTTRLETTSLSRTDREVIDLEMARRNVCHYCVPAHVKLAREGGLAEADIAAIVAGELAPTPRSRLIQELARRLVETRGGLDDAAFDDFRARGVSAEQMIEAIAEIAHCTLTNYMNRLAQTELDPFLAEVSY